MPARSQPTDRFDGFTYGIELECFVPYETNRLTDTPFDRSSDHRGVQQSLTAEIASIGANSGSDGSIRYNSNCFPIETRSDVVNNQNMETHLTKLCEVLNKYKADVNNSCGYHAHIAHPLFFKRFNLLRLVHVWAAIEDVMFATQPSSRFNNQYCKRLLRPYIQGNFDKLPQRKQRLVQEMSGQDRYMALNLSALRKHSTVEVRLHAGTTNPTKIINWIKLLRAIYAYVFYSYNKADVNELFNMTLSMEKVQKALDLIGVEDDVKTHFIERTQSFNDDKSLKEYGEKLVKQTKSAIEAMGKKQQLKRLEANYTKAMTKYNEYTNQYAQLIDQLN